MHAAGDRASLCTGRQAKRPTEPSSRKIPVTAPARTILDLAAHDAQAGERAVDRALAEEKTTIDALRACACARRGTRGARALGSVLDAAERFDGITRSELEEAFAALASAAGLGDPKRSELVCGVRVDAVWPDERVAVELDGCRWHRTRARTESDRDRELRLRAAGWLVLRYSARRVFEEPMLVVADLARALAARRGTR